MSGTQKGKRKRFTTLEDHHLLTQYVSLGYNNYSNKKVFWGKLYEIFLSCIGNNANDRTQRAVENRFGRIRTEVDNFNKCLSTATLHNQDLDPINLVRYLYMLIIISVYSCY